MKKSKIDRTRILAILIIILGMVYFYANLLAPRFIPGALRIGTIRQPLNILILGIDSNFDVNTRKRIENSEGRTDSILLMHIDPARYQARLLSIPRDSFVEIPGYGWQKINAANVYGGTSLLKEVIYNLTGKKIDYFIKLNPEAIIKLVDLVGGIKFYVEKDMYYVDRAQGLNINLKEGWHKLSGKEAQDYMRFRHDTYGDISRIERQQKFMQTMFLSFARPSNILKAPLALEIASQNIKTDLSFSQVVRLLNFLRMLSSRGIKAFTASGEAATSPYAGSIWQLDKNALEQVLKENF